MLRMLGLHRFGLAFLMVTVGRLVLVGQFDENVFEAGSERADFADSGAAPRELLAKIFKLELVVNQCVNGLAEDSGAADSLDLAGAGECASDFGSGDFDSNRAGRLNVGKFA